MPLKAGRRQGPWMKDEVNMVIATRKVDGRSRVVLPDDFANATVVIERVGNGELRLRKKKTLSQLVAGITPENVHGEWDTGPAVGREVL